MKLTFNDATELTNPVRRHSADGRISIVQDDLGVRGRIENHVF